MYSCLDLTDVRKQGTAEMSGNCHDLSKINKGIPTDVFQKMADSCNKIMDTFLEKHKELEEETENAKKSMQEQTDSLLPNPKTQPENRPVSTQETEEAQEEVRRLICEKILA